MVENFLQKGENLTFCIFGKFFTTKTTYICGKTTCTKMDNIVKVTTKHVKNTTIYGYYNRTKRHGLQKSQKLSI